MGNTSYLHEKLVMRIDHLLTLLLESLTFHLPYTWSMLQDMTAKRPTEISAGRSDCFILLLLYP